MISVQAPRRVAPPCNACEPEGTACFVGEGGDVTIDVSNDMLRRQVTVVGSWTFSKNGQGDCAEFVAERGVDKPHVEAATARARGRRARSGGISSGAASNERTHHDAGLLSGSMTARLAAAVMPGHRLE